MVKALPFCSLSLQVAEPRLAISGVQTRMPEATLVYHGIGETISASGRADSARRNMNRNRTLTLSRDSPGPSEGIHRSAFSRDTNKGTKEP